MSSGARIIDGNAVAASIVGELKAEVESLGEEKPHIVFVRVGEDAASISYLRKKQEVCEQVGIRSSMKVYAETTTQEDLIREIEELNLDDDIDGILVQSPLPAHMQEREVFNRVHPVKDVDGFSDINLGKLVQGDEGGFVACTPAGILEIFEREKIELSGKRVVIVGRSLIVGKPLSLLLGRKGVDATVVVCHSKTANIDEELKRADIIVAAMGVAGFIKAEMVKAGAVVMDVGINRSEDGLVGDVDFEGVKEVAGALTPVPGGVGPMTVAMLMRNVVQAYRIRRDF